MFKPLILYIGLRYTRAKRRTQFISFITLTSVMGIALGVTALIAVLSVMNGFEAELRERILGMTSHSTITGKNGDLESWQILEQRLKGHPRIQGVAPFIEGEVMINADRRVSGSMLRGIDPLYEPRVSEVGNKMLAGGQLLDLKSGDYGIILGAELANYLGAMVGDKITVITPQLNATPAGVMPRLKRFTVVGVFQVGMFEYDRNMALIHIEDAQKLFRMPDTVTGLRLKLDDLFNAPELSRQLAIQLYDEYQVSDWTKAHDNFFRAVKTEKRVMFIILLLIVAVAAFNIVSTLVMVVTDKRGDIAILKTQGLTNGSVMGIFIVLGGIIGVVGTLLGTLGGVVLALNIEIIVPAIENFLGIHFMAADVYYISEVPSKLIWADVYAIAGMAALLSLLATIYPAWQASKVNPAEVLRYE